MSRRVAMPVLGIALWSGPFLSRFASAEVQPLSARIDQLKEKVKSNAQIGEPEKDAPRIGANTSTMANNALTILELNGNPATAEHWLELTFRVQDMDSASARYGDFPFLVGRAQPVDTNTVEFTMWYAGTAMVAHGDKLSSEFRSAAMPHLKAAVAAIRRNNVGVDYTNIYLMKTANFFILGKLLRDPSVTAEGEKCLSDWFAWTKINGNHEYDSPTYSAVQLACLLEIYRQAENPLSKAKAKAALDYLWADLSANYFATIGSVSGAYSRTYDFLYQNEQVRYFYFLEGFASQLTGPDEMHGEWLRVASSDYHPADEIRALASIPERVILQRFGPAADQARYNYITPGFAISSSSYTYSHQDQKLTVQLASSKHLPTISVLTSNTDRPFGGDQATKGHKAAHLVEGIAAVQHKGVVLGLLDLSAKLGQTQSATVSTNISIPVDADSIYLDGRKITADSRFSFPVTQKTVVYVREGNAAIAARIFHADAVAGQQPVLALNYDGNKERAARFVAYHYRGAAKAINPPTLRAGVVLLAAKCANDDEFSSFVQRASRCQIAESTERNQWFASLKLPDVQVSTAIDLTSKRCIYRRVNGTDAPRSRLEVNGRDLAAELLDPLR